MNIDEMKSIFDKEFDNAKSLSCREYIELMRYIIFKATDNLHDHCQMIQDNFHIN